MPGGEAMREQIQAALSGLGPAEMMDVLQRLLAVPDAPNSLLERPPPPSRRRPRRAGTEVPRSFQTVHPIGWTSGKVKVIASTEEELLS
jgi:hypothetical protein